MFHSKAAGIGMMIAGAVILGAGCGANQSGPSTGNKTETCQTNCTNAAPAASQTTLNNIFDCICTSCATECSSQCGGGTGSTGGTTGSTGGTTGAAGTCNSCQTTVLASGAACDAQVMAC